MLFKLSNLNSNLALTLGYLNSALNNSAQSLKLVPLFTGTRERSNIDIIYYLLLQKENCFLW